MDLKIKDVAELLNISETTVRRWLAEGKIPAYRINHQYRFSRGEIQAWVMNQKLGKLTLDPHTEEASGDATETDGNTTTASGIQQFSLYRAIHKGGVMKLHGVHTKEEVIRQAMIPIAERLDVDAVGLAELLLDRERLQPTALNHGFGIPHTRDFLLKGSSDAVTVVFLDQPIDYDALDGQPVDTLFFLFACEDKRHLHLLAKIALLCSKPQAIEFLASRPSENELLAFIKEWESSIPRRQ
jgi:PTS system nitrogen regulatory IIA component